MNDIDLVMKTLKVKTYKCYCLTYYEDILYNGEKYKNLELWCNERIVECKRLFREPTEQEMLNFIKDYIKNKRIGERVMSLDTEMAEQIVKLNEENKILKKALELAVNYLQREIDGADLMVTEVQAIYEIGKDYFIDKQRRV